MPAFTRVRRCLVLLLAALLMGGGPPADAVSSDIATDTGLMSESARRMIGGGGLRLPSKRFESTKAVCGAWDSDEPRSPPVRVVQPLPAKERRTVMINHVFAVPLPTGALLAGDADFLIYPPDVSPVAEHLGEGLGGVGSGAEVVPLPVFPDDDAGENPEEGPYYWRYPDGPLVILQNGPDYWRYPGGARVSPWDDPPPRPERHRLLRRWPSDLPPLLGVSWAVIAPANAFSEWVRPAKEKAGHIHFAFTGEVGPGRKLSTPRQAAAPVSPVIDPTTLPVYSSIDDFIDYQRRWKDHMARSRCWASFGNFHF